MLLEYFQVTAQIRRSGFVALYLSTGGLRKRCGTDQNNIMNVQVAGIGHYSPYLAYERIEIILPLLPGQFDRYDQLLAVLRLDMKCREMIGLECRIAIPD